MSGARSDTREPRRPVRRSRTSRHRRAWHEDQQPGLGDRFLDAVKDAVDRARRWPNSGTPVVWDNGGEVVERKVATRGFTWAIRYRVGDTELVVMAVHHQRRHPEHGADRRP